MSKAAKDNRIVMLLILAVTATLMAELLTGSTPVSRAYMLLSELLLYGSGVILIREIVRRLKLGWVSIILLGVAYGLAEEGLAMQSIFNPHFLGIDNSLGRMAGVNWLWAEYIIGLHCFWSITGSIIVCELIYFKERNERWLNKTGLWIMGCIFLCMCIALHFLFIRISHFKANPVALLLLLILIIGVIFSALRIPPKTPPANAMKKSEDASSFWIISIITFAACAAWFIGLGAVFSRNSINPLIIFIGGPLILCVYFYLMKKSLSLDMNSPKQRLAVATGLLPAELIWGYLLTRHHPIDHDAQIVFIILVLLFIYFLYKKQARISM